MAANKDGVVEVTVHVPMCPAGDVTRFVAELDGYAGLKDSVAFKAGAIVVLNKVMDMISGQKDVTAIESEVDRMLGNVLRELKNALTSKKA